MTKIPADSPIKKAREKLMISKMELARRADISPITLARIENGKPCRISTKRKIVEALGFNPWKQRDIGDDIRKVSLQSKKVSIKWKHLNFLKM